MYSKDGSVYASVLGMVVSSSTNAVTLYSVSNNLPTKKIGLTIGDIVYGSVLRVRE